MTTITVGATFITVDCPACAFVFAVPKTFRSRCEREGKSMHCPACAGGMNWGESEADKLRKQLEAAQRRLSGAQGTITHLSDQRDAAERSARAQRAANTRLRKRVSNGVCPCCRRTFADLARHMEGQHPDYAATVDAS